MPGRSSAFDDDGARRMSAQTAAVEQHVEQQAADPQSLNMLASAMLEAMTGAGMANLRAFGEQAERLEYPFIDVGGFIVPGRDPVMPISPGTEHDRHDAVEPPREGWQQSPSEQAGSAAWTRQRSAQAAPGASPHALGHDLTHSYLGLSALTSFHPLTRVVASTESVVYLNLPLGVLPELPFGARLTLEVPRTGRTGLNQSMKLTGVPDVRAWAVWEDGPMHGLRIESHHQNPDRAICANMPEQWMLGVHALHEYVAFCTMWVAKVVHEQLLGFYPGPQHYAAAERVRRDRPDEFCGCGKPRRYRHCCREKDRAMSHYARWHDAQLARRQYLHELKKQGRAPVTPEAPLRLGLRH